MVVMGVDEVIVDFLSLDGFRERLQARRLEAESALTALTDEVRPQLGAFHDAEQTADQYESLRDGYLAALRRLVDAVVTAQAATATALTTYRTGEELNEATLKAFGDGPTRGR
jgi:hypothetical protein